MEEIWQKIVDSWQIKSFCSGAVSCLAFLLGDVTALPQVQQDRLARKGTLREKHGAIEAAVSVSRGNCVGVV